MRNNESFLAAAIKCCEKKQITRENVLTTQDWIVGYGLRVEKR